MLLNGKHDINAPAQRIWNLMMDPVVLARITPCITHLERMSEDHYKAIAEVKIGPVSGAFTGTLKVANRNEPHSFSLLVQQNSRMGNAFADMAMTLSPTESGTTEVSFQGDVKLSGIIASMGQRVLAPVANMLSGQFFDALQKEVNLV